MAAWAEAKFMVGGIVLIVEGLDPEFYGAWYKDLGTLGREELASHWALHGERERRAPNLEALLQQQQLDLTDIPQDFNAADYIQLHDDLATLSTPYEAIHHYLAFGIEEGRSYCVDRPLYNSLYNTALSSTFDIFADWRQHGKKSTRYLSIRELLRGGGISDSFSISELDIQKISSLNPDSFWPTNYHALREAVQHNPPKKIAIFEEAKRNGDFYFNVGTGHAREGRHEQAASAFRLAIEYFPSSRAHEHLGNHYLRGNLTQLAILHYSQAIAHGSASGWSYINLGDMMLAEGRLSEATDIALQGAEVHPEREDLLSLLDRVMTRIWNEATHQFFYLASLHLRSQLAREVERVVSVVSQAYARYFGRFSPYAAPTNSTLDRVLIVGSLGLPQCFRYRMAQKILQLESIGVPCKAVSYLSAGEAMQEINFASILLLYRVPAEPDIIKLCEYARALGKTIYYDIDDLLFDADYPPPIESYGNQVSTTGYLSLITDGGLFRGAIGLADVAIASTSPLLAELMPLTRSRKGFVHRNGIDPTITEAERASTEGHSINIFYGSGTLAHNRDFMELALPAVKRVLEENLNTRLVIAGHLKLPIDFITEFKSRLVTLPMFSDVSVYYYFLGAAHINLAVLNRSLTNDCKSEIKWSEAACFGIPSIVSGTKNYRDCINSGVDALICEDPNEWYAAISSLVADAELRQTLGSAARMRVLNDYSIAALAQNLQLNLELKTNTKSESLSSVVIN